MTFDDAIEAFVTSESLPEEQIQWVLDEWDTTAAECRALLASYLDGKDWSERTEQALFVVILILAEKEDTASFANVCRLTLDKDRCNSVFGEDEAPVILPAILIGTFGGDASAIFRIVDSPEADDLLRGEVLASLAYLVRTDRLPEAEFYQYLSQFPDKMPESTPEFVWYGWMRAIAMLGFAGLAQRVEQVLKRGSIDPKLMDSATFWQELRAAQADPDDMSSFLWDEVGPIGSAINFLALFSEVEAAEAQAVYEDPPEPIRNPLRDVGRNDPCPCGSGKKFKKCCLAA